MIIKVMCLATFTKVKYISTILLLSLFVISTNLAAQASHNTGLLLRYFLGPGLSEISDQDNNLSSGIGMRTTADVGYFVFEDIALHTGFDFSYSGGVNFSGRRERGTSEGEYYYLALASGLSYYFTGWGLFVSANLRVCLTGLYEFNANIANVVATANQEEATAEETTRHVTWQLSSGALGWNVIVGTEEWFVFDGMGLGISITYSMDFVAAHVFYGFLFTANYN